MSPPEIIVVSKPFIKTNCTLGEGPLYDASSSTLHFVDIVKCQVLHLDVKTFNLSVSQFDEPITCLSLRRNGSGLACTAARGFALINSNNLLEYLSKPLLAEHEGIVRFNDGACDSEGRFFAGTICSPDRDIPGRLFRYDPSDNSTVVVDEGPFTDCNGLGWSPDQRTLYFTDSLVNRIYAYDYDSGSLTNRRLFADTQALGYPDKTYPDGLCIDSEGYVWSARWGNSKIVRFSSTGEVNLEVHFPTALNITACCFGGPENDQLFVTTAHCGAIGGDTSRQVTYPDSGHLFRVDFSERFKGGNWRHAFNG